MADHNALPLVILAEKFASLPGIGMKSAQRLAYHIMSMSEDSVEEFAQALVDAKKNVHCCKRCQNLTEREICPICSDEDRDKSIVCVVESPKDVTAFERQDAGRLSSSIMQAAFRLSWKRSRACFIWML